LASRARAVGKAFAGAATAVPAAVGVYYTTIFGRVYRRPINAGAQSRDDYGKLPEALGNESNFPSWIMPLSVTTWNHILDGHSPESTYRDTDKFIDGSTEAIVAAIFNAIPWSELELRNGDPQFHYSYFNGQRIRIFFQYVYGTGKWEITSVHPYLKDIVSTHFSRR
jgi:plasmid maintenance system killer protein